MNDESMLPLDDATSMDAKAPARPGGESVQHFSAGRAPVDHRPGDARDDASEAPPAVQEPSDASARPSEASQLPSEPSGEPSAASSESPGEPSETSSHLPGEPSTATQEPSVAAGGPSEASAAPGEPSEASLEGNPAEPPLGPAPTPMNPAQGAAGVLEGMAHAEAEASDNGQGSDPETTQATEAFSPPGHASVSVGDVVAGRYRLLEIIGVGGMGTVFLAEHTAIGKRVALKVLALNFARQESFRLRFAQEAKVVSQINHENVVEVTDFGETEDGCPFLVMEYLRGRGLAQVLREEGPLPWARAQPIFVQICKALHAAHHQGILHRDIKPENCFVVRRGTRDVVKVLDFGLATELDRDEVTEGVHPELGGLVGTVEYMSPEQIRGEPLTVRSDLYAVGILMYEVLSGYVPFSGDHHELVMEQHLCARPIALHTLAPEANISAEVEAIVLQALQKEPEARHASAAELGRALAAMATPRRSAAPDHLAFAARERFYMGVILGLSMLVVALMLVLAYVAFATRSV